MKAASLPLLIASALAASTATAHAAPLGEGDVAAITESVDRSAPRLTALARDIWTYAEPGFQETRSAARIQADLKAAGFRIEAGVAKLPTAFIASAGRGGPVIALIAEYDALPGLSQSAAASRQAVPGQTAGHACGHNLVGTAAVGAAIALKAWLAASGHPGTVRLYGTPAEEGGFAKVLLARDGLFDDVDATLNFHPSDQNSAWQVELLSVITGKFRFTGIPAHASAAPERVGTKGAIMAAKALALTAADLFRNPASLAAARAEFDGRRGAGFQYRALIDDQTSEAAPR